MAATGARADVVLNSFESPSNTSFYDWARTPSKSPECPLLAACSGFGGPCASAYQTSSTVTEGLFAARVYLQPDAGGLNCAGTSCIERFRTLTLYNFAPTNWSVGYYRLVLDIRRAAGGPSSLIFSMRVQDTGGNLAYSPTMNLTTTMTGGWYPFGFPVSTMVSQGVDTANLKSVSIILPLPLPSQCATVFLDNLRLEPGVPPCPPLAVSAVATGVAGQIRLGWTISCSGTNAVAGYRIYRNTSAIVTLPGAPTSTVATGFLDSGLVNGVRYHYRVVTVDDQGAVSGAGDPADDDADVPWGCSPPGEIAALSATATASSVDLAWLSPTPNSTTILQFEVLRGPPATPPGSMTVVATIPYTGPGGYAHSDTTVPPGGTFCFCIRTVETLGCSSTSPIACATVPCNLSPPTGLSGLGFCDRIRLAWGAISATEYRIYRSSTGPACTGSLVAQPAPPQTAWDDVGVVNGVTYAYAITAWSPTCESACSTQQSVAFDALAPCPPCLPPGVPAPPVLAAGSRRVTVTWSRPVTGGSPISRYFVWLGAGATGSLAGKVNTATVWDQPGGPVFTITVTGLALDTQYCAIVETLDDGAPACTSFTGEACAATACVTPPPPVIASVAPVAAGTVAVSWPRPVAVEEPLTRYLVLRATASGGPAVVAGTVYDAPVASFTFTDTGLGAPLDYCYRLLTIDAAGCTSWSADVCTACSPPGSPGGLTAQVVTLSAIALAWIPSTPGALGVSRYEVFRSTFAGGAKPMIGIAWGPAAAGYLDTPVSALASWFYLVRAVDEAGCSAFSAERPYVYAPPGPVAPVTVTALLTAAGMYLEWAPATPGSWGVSTYVIWRASTATGPVVVAATVWHDPAAISFTLTDAGVALNRGWAYRIQILDAIGGSVWSGPFTYTPAPPAWNLNDPLPAFAQTGSSLYLDWDAAMPGWLAVSRYLVFRSTNTASCAGPLTLTATVWDDGSARFSMTDTGLALGRQYGYRFLAIDLGGSTAFSVCTTTPACAIPVWPGGTASLFAASVAGGSALVWWSLTPTAAPGNPVTAYAVYRTSTGSCGTGTAIAVVWHDPAVSTYTVTDTGLAASQPYSYQVVALTVNGCGAPADCATIGTSGLCSFTVQPTASIQPGPTGRPSVRITWGVTATGSPGTVAVWRSESATGGTAGKTVVATVNMTDGAWLDTGVVAGHTYCYVLVLNVPGISCSATSMESCGQTAALLITVYPNPAEPSKGPVRFDGLPAGSTVEIFTVNGDRVIASPPGAAPLWLWDGRTSAGSPAAPGIYVWLIRGSGPPQRGTLVVGR